MARSSSQMSAQAMLVHRTLERLSIMLNTVPEKEVVAALEKLYRPVLRPDEEMPDWAFELELGRRLVKFLAEDSVEGDRGRRQSVHRRKKGVRGRREWYVALRRDIWTLATRVESHHGREILKILGVAGSRSARYDAVRSQAALVVQILRSDWFSLPAPREGRKALDRFELADELEGSLAIFDRHLETVGRSEASAETALMEKHTRFQQAILGARVVVERVRYTLLLAGRKKLADSLFFRMARTRAQVLAEEEAAEAAVAAAEGSEATATESTATGTAGEETSGGDQDKTSGGDQDKTSGGDQDKG